MEIQQIAYCTTYNAQDIHQWSGTGLNISQALINQNYQIDYIGNLHADISLKNKIDGVLNRLFTRKHFDYLREFNIAEQYAQNILKQLNPKTELVFSPGSQPLALLETKLPKVFYTDATFQSMINFYEGYKNLAYQTIKHGNQLEKLALESSQLAIYASDWAAESAINHYQIDPSKIHVVPFGSNFQYSLNQNELLTVLKQKSQNECHLLFIGVEWQRKGGDIAIKITEQLNKSGIKTFLHVVGLNQIPIPEIPDFVINHGFLSKKNPEHTQKLIQLFCQSHFFLLPTIAEAYGLVFCEANSFGLPALSNKVGGVPTIIKDNINGTVSPILNNVEHFTNFIEFYFSNKAAYQELCFSALNEYQTRLNWNVAGAKIKELINQL